MEAVSGPAEIDVEIVDLGDLASISALGERCARCAACAARVGSSQLQPQPEGGMMRLPGLESAAWPSDERGPRLLFCI